MCVNCDSQDPSNWVSFKQLLQALWPLKRHDKMKVYTASFKLDKDVATVVYNGGAPGTMTLPNITSADFKKMEGKRVKVVNMTANALTFVVTGQTDEILTRLINEDEANTLNTVVNIDALPYKRQAKIGSNVAEMRINTIEIMATKTRWIQVG